MGSKCHQPAMGGPTFNGCNQVGLALVARRRQVCIEISGDHPWSLPVRPLLQQARELGRGLRGEID
eukprot:7477951-Alexandrium_andersonii.AAC.1